MVRRDDKLYHSISWPWLGSWILILSLPFSGYKASDNFFSLTLSFPISMERIIMFNTHVFSD